MGNLELTSEATGNSDFGHLIGETTNLMELRRNAPQGKDAEYQRLLDEQEQLVQNLMKEFPEDKVALAKAIALRAQERHVSVETHPLVVILEQLALSVVVAFSDSQTYIHRILDAEDDYFEDSNVETIHWPTKPCPQKHAIIDVVIVTARYVKEMLNLLKRETTAVEFQQVMPLIEEPLRRIMARQSEQGNHEFLGKIDKSIERINSEAPMLRHLSMMDKEVDITTPLRKAACLAQVMYIVMEEVKGTAFAQKLQEKILVIQNNCAAELEM